MDPLQRNALANGLREFANRPSPKDLAVFAESIGVALSMVEQVADEIWSPGEPVPRLLVDLGREPLRPGLHLAPHCHVLYQGWDGDVTVRTWIEGHLDKRGWQEFPRLDREDVGYWTLHQALSLMCDEGKECRPGTYLIHFECNFHSPVESGAFESSWTGWLRLTVPGGQSSRTLEIESDGHGLVNFNGVDLTKFTSVKLRAGDISLVNFQPFEQALDDEPKSDAGRQPSQVISIPLRRRSTARNLPERPVTTARFDLPDGRRVLLYAQDKLILGRNRPGNNDKPTDVTLRLLPRTEENMAISEGTLSRQQLIVTVRDRHVAVSDPRENDRRIAIPASIDGELIGPSSIVLKNGRTHKYACKLGDQYAIGLGIASYCDDRLADHLQIQLTQLRNQIRRPHQTAWQRDQAGVDAVRIDRTANTDSFNGRESYLMVLGAVLIGSSEDCPIRIDGEHVLPEHAVLIHSDGQFRLMPLGNALVSIDQRDLPPGQFTQLRPENRQWIGIGSLEVLLAPRAQFEMDID